jgi:hypothetical protein
VHPRRAAYYLLDGDLNQMSFMERTLKSAGFNVVRSTSGTYPGFPEDAEHEYIRALKFLWDRQITGWWNQKLAMIRHGVCTAEEFDQVLRESRETRESG